MLQLIRMAVAEVNPILTFSAREPPTSPASPSRTLVKEPDDILSHLSSLTGGWDVEPNLGLHLFRWPQSWSYSATHHNAIDDEEGGDNLVVPKILDVDKISWCCRPPTQI